MDDDPNLLVFLKNFDDFYESLHEHPFVIESEIIQFLYEVSGKPFENLGSRFHFDEPGYPLFGFFEPFLPLVDTSLVLFVKGVPAFLRNLPAKILVFERYDAIIVLLDFTHPRPFLA